MRFAPVHNTIRFNNNLIAISLCTMWLCLIRYKTTSPHQHNSSFLSLSLSRMYSILNCFLLPKHINRTEQMNKCISFKQHHNKNIFLLKCSLSSFKKQTTGTQSFHSFCLSFTTLSWTLQITLPGHKNLILHKNVQITLIVQLNSEQKLFFDFLQQQQYSR